MQIKTITTVAGVNEIDFGNDDSQSTAHFYWFKNLSDSTLYVSAKPTPVAGGDNVAELAAKGATSVETDEGKVYVLGTGKVEIHRTDSKFCPFELPSSGSGGSGSSSQIIKNVRLNGNTSADGFIVTDLPADSIDILSVLCMSPDCVYAEAWALESTGKWCISFYDTNSGALLKKNLDVTYEISYVDKSEAGGGGYIAIDSELSETSVNPLQNKATTAAINEVKSDLVKTQEDVAENAAVLNTKSDVNHIHDITASGNPVILDGLQGGVPFSEMVVSGKNLLYYPYAQTTRTSYGITFTDNGDGSITASGTHDGGTKYSYFGFLPWWNNDTHDRILIKKGMVITCRAIGLPDIFTITMTAMTGNKNGEQIIHKVAYGENPITYTATEDCYIACEIYGSPNSAGQTVDFIVYPQIELGDTATAYEPPITSQEVIITRCGKNLLKPKSSSVSFKGITAVVNDDGSVTINRTEASEENSYIILWNNVPARSIGTKKITINAVDSQSLESCYMGIDRLENGTYLDRVAVGIVNNGVGTVTQEDVDNDRLFRSWIFIHKDYSPNNLTIYPQLELGDAATEYEPYHADTISITPTSNPYAIQNDLLQYNDINTLIASIGELKVVGVQRNAAIKKIWDKFASIDNDIVDLYSKISTLEVNTTASIEANGQEIEAVRNTLSRTNDDLTSVTSNVASNATKIDELETTINTTLYSDIDMLRNDNEALHAEIAELRALIETT